MENLFEHVRSGERQTREAWILRLATCTDELEDNGCTPEELFELYRDDVLFEVKRVSATLYAFDSLIGWDGADDDFYEGPDAENLADLAQAHADHGFEYGDCDDSVVNIDALREALRLYHASPYSTHGQMLARNAIR